MNTKVKQTMRYFTIGIYFLIVFGTLFFLAYHGGSYYRLPIEERFFHPQYELLKPSGLLGHGLGITGATLILTGMLIYILRKRVKFFARWGRVKNWLEFHIFLCTWGTVMVLFHTTFKFGGIISVGFWSLALVWLSGFIGRFIYIQIPRALNDRELTLDELIEIRKQNNLELSEKYNILIADILTTRFSEIRLKLLSGHFTKTEQRKARKLFLKQKTLEKRIARLSQMHRLFHYWHIAHVPFAVLMVIILIIHVSVVLFFGYKWIF